MIEIKYEKVITPAYTWKTQGKEFFYPEKKRIKILKIVALDLDELPAEYLKQSDGYVPACWATTRDSKVRLHIRTPYGMSKMEENGLYDTEVFHEWLGCIAKAKSRLDKIKEEMHKKESKWYGEFEVKI